MVVQLSWESICLTSRGSQVRALQRPPLFYGLVVQLVRMPPCHGGGRRFEPVPGRHFFIFKFGFIAQLVEQRTENPRVSGSIPLEATNFFMVDVAQLVRAPVCGTGGREFESHLPPHLFSTKFIIYWTVAKLLRLFERQ